MHKPNSDVHAEIRARIRQLDAAKPSKDLDILLRYYVGALSAFDQAGHQLLRALM